ncbi:hypothetical protein AVEN_52822-1 [Araneus ventricosus]|uniref:Uncharacterized protein n=1 Tax=Araneus ventricosus TaxID=182803 RepID=A0A4Y2JC06_ARAVE|nr:hypothetical protein AVEN_52822-1 [Araneus ventricosus]
MLCCLGPWPADLPFNYRRCLHKQAATVEHRQSPDYVVLRSWDEIFRLTKCRLAELPQGQPSIHRISPISWPYLNHAVTSTIALSSHVKFETTLPAPIFRWCIHYLKKRDEPQNHYLKDSHRKNHL